MLGGDCAEVRGGGEVDDVAEQVLIGYRGIGASGDHEPGLSEVECLVETLQDGRVEAGERGRLDEDEAGALLDAIPPAQVRLDPFGQPGQVNLPVQLEKRCRAEVHEHPDGSALLTAAGRA